MNDNDSNTDLNLGDDNPPGLLVQPLIVPVRIEVGQLGGESDSCCDNNLTLTRHLTSHLLCSRSHTVWYTVSPGCSLLLLSPALKHFLFSESWTPSSISHSSFTSSASSCGSRILISKLTHSEKITRKTHKNLLHCHSKHCNALCSVGESLCLSVLSSGL